MTHRPFRQNAEAFAVWREGNAIDWECTYADLPRATGLSPHRVQTICMKKGWRLKRLDRVRQVNFENQHCTHRPDLVTMMGSSVDYGENHF